MIGEQYGGSLSGKFAQKKPQPFRAGRVDTGERLVAHEHFGSPCDRPSELKAASLSAR